MLRVSCKFLLLYFLAAMLLGCLDRSPVPSKTNTITAILPDTQTPLPSFLRDVYPKPGSRVTQSVYMTDGDDDSSQFIFRRLAAICVEVEEKNLLEQSDYNLGGDQYAAKSYLKVSTFGPDSHSIPVRNDCVSAIMGGGTLKDERGNEIGGFLALCWDVDLMPGVYEAIYEYMQADYVLSYTWSFEIIE